MPFYFKTMLAKSLASLKLYLAAILLIGGWWFYAFTSPQMTPSISEIPLPHPEIAEAPPPIKYLSRLKRDSLQMALSGDFSLMTKLISEWDVDAQILQSHGIEGIKRIPRQDFLKSQLLHRQLKNNSKEELQTLSNIYRAHIVIDDKKQVFPLKGAYSCFLPQTYVSASFLLALTEPESIAGIPQGLRCQTTLFSPELTKKIPLDIDRSNSEKLFCKKPQLAFVSFYSHPSTLNALASQGVDLFHVDEINSLPEILNALERIGHAIDKPLQSELLKIFISAAMTTIDNRFQALGFHQVEQHPRVLLLNHHTTYSTPSKRTIIAQLLQRIGISAYNDDEACWSHPLDQEQIIQFNPDCLIFATSNPADLHTHLSQTSALVELDAVKNRRFYYVDDKVQNFPSQYIVLAYYDLLTALSDAKLKEKDP